MQVAIREEAYHFLHEHLVAFNTNFSIGRLPRPPSIIPCVQWGGLCAIANGNAPLSHSNRLKQITPGNDFNRPRKHLTELLCDFSFDFRHQRTCHLRPDMPRHLLELAPHARHTPPIADAAGYDVVKPP